MIEHDVNCPDCGAKMVLRQTSKFKYKNGDPRPFYGCSRFPLCKGSHGAHPDGSPLGTPADKMTKELRIDAHDMMDRWMDAQGFSRKQGYARLQEDFGCEVHIGELDAAGCQKLMNYFLEHKQQGSAGGQ